MYLQKFKFEIVHRPGKENKNADALSRAFSIEAYMKSLEVESYFCEAEILGEEPDDNEETNTSESSLFLLL